MTKTPGLHRRKLAAALFEKRGDRVLLVSGLGSPTWDSAAVGDRPDNFYLWGGMGLAAMVGLGLALAQPDQRVVVLTGDGEMLMGLAALATIGARRPANLAVVTFNNGRYGETGMQDSHTALGVDLAASARAAGFAEAMTVREEAEVPAMIEAVYAGPGPVFLDVRVIAEDLPLVLPPRDGCYLKIRFREKLLGRG